MGTINNDSQSCLHFVITWGALKIQGGAPPPEVWFNWSGCICGSRDVRKHPGDSWWAARLGTAVWTAACWLFSGRRSLIGNLGDTQWQAELWKLKHLRIDVFELWCWRRLLRVPWTARRSNQSILKEINPEYSLERLMLKLWYLWYLATWCKEQIHWKRPWC